MCVEGDDDYLQSDGYVVITKVTVDRRKSR